MARLALELKHTNKRNKLLASLAAGRKPKFATKVTNRCTVCGRTHGYMRKFEMCRICFRQLASRGKIMGVKKCSW